MKTQAIVKGPALIVFVTLAVSITSLGIFLDGEVIPNSTPSEDFIPKSGTKSSADSPVSQSTALDQPSEVAQQLKRAIDVANQSDSEENDALATKQIVTQEKITETNQLLEEKGVFKAMDSESEKTRDFNQKIEQLKARLVNLQPAK